MFIITIIYSGDFVQKQYVYTYILWARIFNQYTFSNSEDTYGTCSYFYYYKHKLCIINCKQVTRQGFEFSRSEQANCSQDI